MVGRVLFVLGKWASECERLSLECMAASYDTTVTNAQHPFVNTAVTQTRRIWYFLTHSRRRSLHGRRLRILVGTTQSV